MNIGLYLLLLFYVLLCSLSCIDNGALNYPTNELFKKIDKAFFDGSEDFGTIAISRDQKNIYLTSNTYRPTTGSQALYHCDVTQDLFSPNAWHKIDLNADGSALSTGGKEKITGADHVISLSSGEKGALVYVGGRDYHNNSGLFYLEGYTVNGVWLNNNIVPAGHSAAGKVYLITRDNEEVPYVLISGNSHEYYFNTSLRISEKYIRNKTSFPPAHISFPRTVELAFDGKNLFMVSELGIAIMPKSEIGEASESFTTIIPNATKEKWKFKGQLDHAGTGTVRTIALLNDKLYIGISGGVAVYDITSKTTIPPDISWKGTEVLELFIRNNKMYALTQYNFIVQVDRNTGLKGASLFEESNRPLNILSAQVLNGKVIMLTKEGLYVEN